VAGKTKKQPAAKTRPPATVDDYLAAAPVDRRAALQKLRATIKAAAPKATERVSYGIVGYKLGAKPLVGFGYWKAHVALYGSVSRLMKEHAAELTPYVHSKGTIQFPMDKPIPYGLVAKIVRARVAEVNQAL